MKDGIVVKEALATVSCEKSAVTLQEGETVAYQWVEKSVVFKMKKG